MTLLSISLTAIAAAYLFGSLFLLAPRNPGYSHLRHSISEIGEIGAPDQRLVAFGVFLPVSLLLLAVAALARSSSPLAASLALCIAFGYFIAALFPCDPGSPFSGTTRQAVHNLGGGVEYIGGAFVLLTMARDFTPAFQVAGFTVLGSAFLVSVLPSTPVRGLLQRLAEITLFASLALSLNHGRAPV